MAGGLTSLGFDRFTMNVDAGDRREMALYPTLTTFPQDRLLEYERRRLYDCDPVLIRGAEAAEPFFWDSEADHAGACSDLLEFFRSARAAKGLVVPLPSSNGGISMINASATGRLDNTDETVHAVSILARTAMIRLEALGCLDKDRKVRSLQAGLSERQQNILDWIAQGKSNTDIATITGLSRRTTDYHVAEILRKLGVASRSQAAALWTGRAK